MENRELNIAEGLEDGVRVADKRIKKHAIDILEAGECEGDQKLTPDFLKHLTSGDFKPNGAISNLAEVGAISADFFDAIKENYSDAVNMMIEKFNTFGDETAKIKARAEVEDGISEDMFFRNDREIMKKSFLVLKDRLANMEKMSDQELDKFPLDVLFDKILEGKADMDDYRRRVGRKLDLDESDFLNDLHGAFEDRMELEIQIELIKENK